MDSGEFDLATLDGELEDVRNRLRSGDSPFADEAGAAFDNASSGVGEWLRNADARCRARDYQVARPHHPDPETIYLEMNRFEINPDRWFVDAFACGPPPAPEEPVRIGRHFDAIAGAFLGDVPIAGLTLTGMEAVQRIFERQREAGGRAPDEDLALSLVRLSFFQVLDRAIDAFDGPLLRVVAAVHAEDTFAVWAPSSA